MNRPMTLVAALLLALPAFAKEKKGTPAEAKQFVSDVNTQLKDLWTRQATADWIRENFITDDTERQSAWANEAVMAYVQQSIKSSLRFKDLKLDPTTARMIYLLRVSQTLAAPADAKKRKELATIMAQLDSMYGQGKYCGKDGKAPCKDMLALENVIDTSRNYDELLEAWTGWHSIARPMRPLYVREVELANEGAREVGFKNTGDLWKSAYDMTPDEFERYTTKLYEQVKPLYDQLHCYVRRKLVEKYGADKVPPQGPIPAHLLGNMWAQEWTNIYPLVEPYPGQVNLDVTQALKDQHWDAKKMVKTAENFFVSLGLEPLPKTFWERSLFVKPQDRDVVCHASAWDVQYNGDLRIKVCVQPKEEDLVTLHHELGHDFYYQAYDTLPALFQQGANDGFHEAIGDSIVLSMTPAYLKELGLIKEVPPNNDKALIDQQMKKALEKVAFLPFGKLIDQWRWDVFAGKVTPDHYNQAWWDLREKYQGVAPPVARTEADFDPGAKYHVPSNTPYTRYFLALLLQFQFHRALCKAAGYQGPLYACSIYGNKAAGEKLEAMLKLGASKPWPDALEAISGQRDIDPTAMLDYFQPLQTWLAQQNQGQKCGW